MGVTERAARCAPWLATLLVTSLVAGAAAQSPDASRARRGGQPPPDEPDRGAIERNTLALEFDEHLDDVHKRLKLQPAQQPAWEAFAARAQALMLDQLRGVAPYPEHEDAPHQINRRVDVVRNRLAAMEDVADAASQLYSVLSEEQRKHADELLPTAVPSLYSGLPEFGKGARAQSASGKR